MLVAVVPAVVVPVADGPQRHAAVVGLAVELGVVVTAIGGPHCGGAQGGGVSGGLPFSV